MDQFMARHVFSIVGVLSACLVLAGVINVVLCGMLGTISANSAWSAWRQSRRNRVEHERLWKLAERSLRDEPPEEIPDKFPGTSQGFLTVHLRHLGRVAELGEQSTRAQLLQDKEVLETLHRLRRMILRDRRSNPGAWSTEFINSNLSPLDKFFCDDCELSRDTLRLLLKGAASRLPEHFTRVMNAMPPDIGDYLKTLCDTDTSPHDVLN